jgi:bloom syndrome protein
MVSEKLNAMGLRTHHYHANMAPDVKQSIQNKWSNDEIHIIVATIAFGM